MPALWRLDDVERDDANRAAQLRRSPPWFELVRQVCEALRAALVAGDAKFGCDESRRDCRDLRSIVQFPVGLQIFDWFFNSHTGYRAQFRIGRENGCVQNAFLVSELRAELSHFAPREITARRLSYEFKDKGPIPSALDAIVSSLDPHLSKVWVCEKLISGAGEVRDLFVSRTGPRLVFENSEPWSSLFPENSSGWLDLKGAFIGTNGMYQLKLPKTRAADLETRGSA